MKLLKKTREQTTGKSQNKKGWLKTIIFPDRIEKINKTIEQAGERLAEGNITGAKTTYESIKPTFLRLSEEDQKKVYPKILGFYKKLNKKPDNPKKPKPKEAKMHTPRKKTKTGWLKTGVDGLDRLLGKGIPSGSSTIIAGGPGSGKTILCLQIANYAATNGQKVLYISIEENDDRLMKHMHDFKWNPEELDKKGNLKIIRVDPFSISRNVEALLAKAKGELIMEIKEIKGLIPKNFNPSWVILDSITALESAFKDEEETYRIYIEQLFRYFEKLGVTSLLITETENIPKTYSKTGVEEFLADGVIVLYHIKRGTLRERAIEVLKLRGAAHQNKIVAMDIKSDKGIEVYPEQEIFGEIE